ncbi:MAG: Crp/Fnr family transcriptional regulator [Longicatena sp.]
MKTSMIESFALFQHIQETELEHVLQNLQAYTKSYEKGDFILYTGDYAPSMGIVLSGNVSVVQRDVWGKENIFHQIHEGGMFAETYAYLEHEPLMVDVIANCKSEILFLNIRALWELPMNKTNASLMKNLTHILAQKNLHLSRKIEHITPRTIRERVFSYLQDQSIKQNTTHLHISFDRQQLADYLCVERSALSHELSKLQKEGKIKLEKHFIDLII